MSQSVYYYQAVLIATDYLGPAAERFIDRQVTFHLKKNPHQLEKKDLPELAEWIKVSIAVLTDDQGLVNDFSRRIGELTK